MKIGPRVPIGHVGFGLGAHPDLVNAFGATGFEAAAAHWMELGRAEGGKPYRGDVGLPPQAEAPTDRVRPEATAGTGGR